MSLIAELIERSGLGESDLLRIINTAPARYKVFRIPKRRGGERTIAQPSRELKFIQRYLVDTRLAKLPVHPAATAYIAEQNILWNAQAHQRNRILLKLDFENFFPSLKVSDWRKFLLRAKPAEVVGDEEHLFEKILFWGEKRKSVRPTCLSIGAPSSPILSNILMYELDQKFSEVAGRFGVAYTRYADDITASAARLEDVRSFEAEVRKLVRATRSPRLKFNESKRGVYARGQRRMVTGLIVTPTNNISIGRGRKRLISAMLHHVAQNRSDDDSMGRLKGLLGFCVANEPLFLNRLREKYGDEPLDRVLRFKIPPRAARRPPTPSAS